MEIKSKAQFFEMWEAGLLGNRTRLWRDPNDAYQWAVEQRAKSSNRFWQLSDKPIIGFRELGRAGGGAWEVVPWRFVHVTAERWNGAHRRFIMDDGAPEEKTTLKGEVCRTVRGLESYLTTAKLSMRAAMREGRMKPYGNLATKVALDTFMDPASRDDLEILLELYPDATIEFSCFSVDVGVIPNRNTLFWEVRNY